MSRRDDHRDSSSRRHRSRFDREPSRSPKRSRRDGKPEAERSDIGDRINRDQKNRGRLVDGLKGEHGSGERKANGNGDRAKDAADPTKTPRPRSYFQQHDERGSTRQDGRRSINAEERGRREEKDRLDEAAANKALTNDARPRNVKSQARENDSWRHDKFEEIEADSPPARKRRAFTEKKIPVDPEKVEKDETKLVKSSFSDCPTQGSDRREERGRSPHHLDRTDRSFTRNRAIYGEERRGMYPPRERYGGGNSGNYRGGRDRFNRRQSNTRVDKWKHDLFDEANRSPPPKNEEEQMAKLEELLAS